MKKIIISICLIISGFICSTYASSVNYPAEQVCTEVMGVTGDLSIINNNTKACASFNNHNNYAVTVSWSVFAYDSNGNHKEIASGNTALKANGTGSGYTFSLQGYNSPSLKMKVYKCS